MSIIIIINIIIIIMIIIIIIIIIHYYYYSNIVRQFPRAPRLVHVRAVIQHRAAWGLKTRQDKTRHDKP